MIALSGADIATLLPTKTAIALVADALKAASNGAATLPLRHALDLGSNDKLGIMPGMMDEPAVFGTKLISLFPDNPTKGYSSHLGLMVLFERKYGTPVAIMDAGQLTAIRTAAASAVATDQLARKDADVLAIIGTGEQAEFHINALREVRNIHTLRLAGRTPERAQAFAAKMAALHRDLNIMATDSPRMAVTGADIVCTVTSAHQTVLKGDWIAAGTHVNAVGASVPTMREIDGELVRKSALYVDYRPSALAQARDIIETLETGLIDHDHIRGEIGEVLQDRTQGRQTDTEITLFRSLGIATEDLVCADYVVKQAKKRKMGSNIPI